MENKWIHCPVCSNKTRDKIREDTVLRNYPLYCPKCKQEKMPICYKLNGKIFAQLYSNDKDYKITLKCTADAGSFYRDIRSKKSKLDLFIKNIV